ncbi:hypothetical protein Tco_1418120 [Tanacetum coccineum]
MFVHYCLLPYALDHHQRIGPSNCQHGSRKIPLLVLGGIVFELARMVFDEVRWLLFGRTVVVGGGILSILSSGSGFEGLGRASMISSIKGLEGGDDDFIIGEGVVVSSSSFVKSIKSCLGGMMVSLIFLEGLEDEAMVEAIGVEAE